MTNLERIRKEKKLTIEQLALQAIINQSHEKGIYYQTLDHFNHTVFNTIEELKRCEKYFFLRINDSWKYIAQVLNCSVDELKEEE